ncbi:MAG: polysaccharide biosynthesis C-terminal domain-containing protein [Ferruginibacter sp.]
MPEIQAIELVKEPGIGFAKRTSLLIGSRLLKLFVQLIILYYYSRNLSYDEYGIYQSVWLYINVISVISLFGLPSLLLSSSNRDIKKWIKDNKKIFLPAALLCNLIPILYILVGTEYYSSSDRALIIALTIIQNVTIILETIAIKNIKEKQVFIANIIFNAGYLVSHILVLKKGYSLSLLLSWLLVVFFLKILLFLPFRANEVHATDHKADTGKQWFFLGLFDVVSVLYKWLDKWVILIFISVSQFAVYLNGAYEIPVFALLASAVGNIMVVELSRQNFTDPVKVKSLFMSSAIFLASVVFPSFCFLLFYHREIFILLFSSKYEAAIPVFLISIFVIPVRITNFTTALQVYNRNDLVLKGAVLDILLAIILMVILYPFLKLPGLALAFVLSTYFQSAYYLWHTSLLLKKNISYFFPFRKLLLMMLISLIIAGIAYYLLSLLAYPYNIIGGAGICVALITVFLWHYFSQHPRVISG